MNVQDKKLLEKHGWVVNCESPFDISHHDGSFATECAAEIVLKHLKDELTWREDQRRKLAMEIFKDIVHVNMVRDNEANLLLMAENAVRAADALMTELDKERA